MVHKNTRHPLDSAYGKYQIKGRSLVDADWLTEDGRKWTPKAIAAGMKNNPDGTANFDGFLKGDKAEKAQEAAMDDYIGKSVNYVHRMKSKPYDSAGQTIHGLSGGDITITEAGLVAAVHREGNRNVADETNGYLPRERAQ